MGKKKKIEPFRDEVIVSLLAERAKYTAEKKTDRVAQVNEQLKLGGYDPKKNYGAQPDDDDDDEEEDETDNDTNQAPPASSNTSQTNAASARPSRADAKAAAAATK